MSLQHGTTLIHRLALTFIAMSVLIFASSATNAADEKTASSPGPKIKIVLIGDSTVNDSQGWGPGFKTCLTSDAVCVNLAQNGRSSRSFIKEGWWAKALAEKPDYVLMQFGHNDQPGKGPERETDPATTYTENLKKFVDETRAIGGKPIIVTSLARRTFKGGKLESTLTPYAEAAKKLAAAEKIPMIDLAALSTDLVEKMGPEAAKVFDPEPKPEAKDKRADRTHLSPKGQEVFGKLMADEVKKAVPGLAGYFR